MPNNNSSDSSHGELILALAGTSTDPPTAIDVLESIFKNAIHHQASDIHLESQARELRVRYRIDGLLSVTQTPPPILKDAVLSRLKVLAGMDIAEKRLPQDGRFQYDDGTQKVDLRVSSLPTTQGEKLVVRLLYYAKERPALSELGYSNQDQQHLIQAIHKPHGLVLITGPTGSGKTLSLYSCLDLLNTLERNVSTVEDPVEIHLTGVNQVQTNEKAGLTFSHTLRALLRQDPDVLMVGEIRDTETAEIAMQAAQTGHLVLSTLHTNDAPSTLARLRHMGIAGFQVAASVSLVTAQRLIRCLCPACKTPLSQTQQETWQRSLSSEDLAVLQKNGLAQATLYQAVGCNACHHGYKGRTGVYQIMPITATMQNLIVQGQATAALAEQAALEGVLTLRQAGWLKAMQGTTSLEEVTGATVDA